MRCSAAKCCALFAFISVTGCSGVPPYDLPENPKGISVHHIVNRIKCEILEAENDHPNLSTDRWVAVASLTLQVDDQGSLTPNVSFIHPLATAGTSFVFNVGANVTGDRERIYTENITIDIRELKSGVKRKRQNVCEPRYDSPLTGDLGIRETVDMAFRSLKEGGPVDFRHSDSSSPFGQTVQFVLTRSLNGVGPNWTLVHFKGPGGSLAGLQRKDTNKLLISFAKPKAGPPGIAAYGILGPAKSGAEAAAAGNNLQMLIQSTRGSNAGF
ncbi:MAG TPA: hypothetical protein VFB23_04910 [Candidatus Acidoferrales bacterium]|nr:hypothetical protein [Candidatus Acidoferrales bacterium]